MRFAPARSNESGGTRLRMIPAGVNKLINGIPPSLGSYAPVLDEIETLLDSPECSLATLGEAIEKEPDLTVRLLRMANSSFYGFSSRVATVSEAISLIGIQQVQDLILASAIISQFKGMAAEFVSVESFWQHSLACGIGSRTIAMEKRLPKADKFFIAGLLHDMGRLILYCRAPQSAQKVFELYHNEKILLTEAEKRVLGFDHQQIAGAVLQLWKFPHNIVQAVACHHNPESSQSARVEASVVHLADHLVNAMQIGSSGERFVPPLDMRAWETLGLTTGMLPRVMAEIDNQLNSVQGVFLN
jgi:HD-like signal output (HDOD) protein